MYSVYNSSQKLSSSFAQIRTSPRPLQVNSKHPTGSWKRSNHGHELFGISRVKTHGTHGKQLTNQQTNKQTNKQQPANKHHCQQPATTLCFHTLPPLKLRSNLKKQAAKSLRLFWPKIKNMEPQGNTKEVSKKTHDVIKSIKFIWCPDSNSPCSSHLRIFGVRVRVLRYVRRGHVIFCKEKWIKKRVKESNTKAS